MQPRGLRLIVYESSEKVIIRNNNERKRKISVFADSISLVENSDSDIEITVQEFGKKIELLIADNYIRPGKRKLLPNNEGILFSTKE